jgi:hypothetical protein
MSRCGIKANEKVLRARESGKFNDPQWWRFGRHQSIDKQDQPKLMVPRLLLHLFAGADTRGQFCIDNVDVGGVLTHNERELHFVLAILNSRACDWAWRLTSKPFRGEYRSANKQFIAPLPIPKTKDPKPLAELAKQLTELHGQRIDVMKAVHRRFQVDLAPAELVAASPLPPRLPGRIQAFDAMPLGQIINELETFAKRKFRPAERAHWDEYLTAQSNAVAAIARGITDLTADLNERVYNLYGLSPDDIKVIEEA